MRCNISRKIIIHDHCIKMYKACWSTESLRAHRQISRALYCVYRLLTLSVCARCAKNFPFKHFSNLLNINKPCKSTEALEIYDGLAFDDETQKKDIDVVLQKLEEFCIGTTNEIYECYLFNKRDQAVGESIDTYVAALRSLSKTCNYGALTDNLIRDRMVVGILDKGIRKKLLQESKLTLQSCIDIARANECTKQQLQTMDHTEDVHADDIKSSKGDPPSGKQVKQIDCKFCGKKHLWKKEECPAWGKTCAKCEKRITLLECVTNHHR